MKSRCVCSFQKAFIAFEGDGKLRVAETGDELPGAVAIALPSGYSVGRCAGGYEAIVDRDDRFCEITRDDDGWPRLWPPRKAYAQGVRARAA